MDRGVGKSQGLVKFTIREVNLCVLSCKERRGPHVHPPLFKKKGSQEPSAWKRQYFKKCYGVKKGSGSGEETQLSFIHRGAGRKQSGWVELTEEKL